MFFSKNFLSALFFACSGARLERAARAAARHVSEPRVGRDRETAKEPSFRSRFSRFSFVSWALTARFGQCALRLHFLLPRALRTGRAPALSLLWASNFAVALDFMLSKKLFGTKLNVPSSPYSLAPHHARSTGPLAVTLQLSSTPPSPPQRPVFSH